MSEADHAPKADDSPRVVGIHSGALGDVILFSRLLARLDGRTTLIAPGEKARLMAELRLVDEAMDFHDLPWEEIFHPAPPKASRLAERIGECDRLVSCFPAGDREAEIRLVGLLGAESAAFLPVRPPADYQGHLVQFWCDMVGIDPTPEGFRNRVRLAGQSSRARPARAAKHLEKPLAVLHPGAGAAEKCWPRERFTELAQALSERWRIVFALGPVEAEARADLLDALKPWEVVRCESLGDLKSLLLGAELFVGNDSGPAHLADLLAVKTVTLFGPTNPRQFHPLESGGNVLYEGTGDMRRISLSTVLQKCNDLFSQFLE